MTNTATIVTRNISTLARLGMLIGLVAAMLLASQADTFARERDEQPEEPPRKEEPRGTSIEEDPADNGNSLEEDPADNGNSLSELELDPIVVRSIDDGRNLTSTHQGTAEIEEEIQFVYKSIKFNH